MISFQLWKTHNFNKQTFQLFQLLACDWILETRTAVWEMDYIAMDEDGYYQVPGEILEKFQNDLNSLRSIVEDIPVGFGLSLKYVYELVI